MRNTGRGRAPMFTADEWEGSYAYTFKWEKSLMCKIPFTP